METLASGSIDLKSLKVASEEANQYITTIDGGGIKVHDSGNINDYIQITSSGVDIYKYNGIDNSEKVASFTSDKTTIGKTENTRVEIDYRSIQLKDKEQSTYFWVSDLRDENGDYEKTDTFKGDGHETFFTLNNTAKNTNYVVTVNGDIVTPSQIYTTVFCIEPAPSKGATIVAEYITQDKNLKAFTFGSRRTNNFNKIGIMSFAEGDHIRASGNVSHAEGSYTIASGNSSHAEGYHTTASGEFTHSEGLNSEAKKFGSHAEGSETIADGIYSHAEGNLSKTTGESSHAEGYQTIASGYTSHAEGKDTTASGYASHAQNKKTIAASESQTAIGKYNIPDMITDTFIGDGTTTDFPLSVDPGETGKMLLCTIDGQKGSSFYYDPEIYNGMLTLTRAPGQGIEVVVTYTLEKYAFIVGNGTAENARSNAFMIDWQGNIIAQGMAGMIMMFGGTTEPAGWLFCDGTTYNVSDYPELAAVLGSTYGGNGTTTFAVPDLRGRFPLGVSSSYPITGTNSSGGASTVTLTASQIPGHTHGPGTLNITASGSHAHKLTYETDAASGTAKNRVVPGDDTGSKTGSNDATKTATHTHPSSNFAGATAQNTGGGGAHNNMPPYRTVNFIIATGKTS